MAGLLAGRVAIVTGGTSGIGRAIATEYLRQGASVTVGHLGDDVSKKQLNDMQRQLPPGARLTDVTGDVGLRETSRDIVNKTVQEFGKLDILVANAGVGVFSDFLTIEEKVLEKHLHVNTRGTFWSVREAARRMVEQGSGGSIIGVSSISALVGGAQQVHYTPTKAAVLSIMQSSACALGKYGIRCNALLPGHTRTPMSESDLTSNRKLEYLEEHRIPLKRVGQPEDMAGPAVFLASDMSRYVNGAQLLVDGGLFVNLQ